VKRILTVLALALIVAAVMAVTVGPALAKQATSGPQGTGQTVTHQGNSTNSPVVACHHGSAGSSGSSC
jgi:hypothetical protein